jgi:hypothetical protein
MQLERPRPNVRAGAFLDSQSLTRLQKRANCRAVLGSSARECGHSPARNCCMARGRFFAASGQNARTPSLPGRTRSRVSRICSRPAPKRRLENDHSPPLISSRIPLDWLVGSRTRRSRAPAPIAISRITGRCLAIYLPLLGLKLPTQAFVPYTTPTENLPEAGDEQP